MARGGGNLQVGVKIDADKASDEFKAARRQFNRDLKTAMQGAAEETILPAAKRGAAGLSVEGISVPGSLVIRARSNHAILQSTMRGKKNRAVGLLEFGRTNEKKLRAKKKKALAWPGAEHPTVEVTLPPLKGRGFLVGAVNDNLHRFEPALLRHVMQAFDGLPHTP